MPNKNLKHYKICFPELNSSFDLDEIVRFANGDAVVAESGRQILHGERVLAILVGAGLGLGTVTGAGRIAGASLAVLQSIVRHVRNELLGGDRDETDTENIARMLEYTFIHIFFFVLLTFSDRKPRIRRSSSSTT